jgi:hypothetical protein
VQRLARAVLRMADGQQVGDSAGNTGEPN